MTKRIALLVFLLYSIIANGQNWKPINGSDKYNYSVYNTPLATIWADSVKVINNDSVFFLNKVLKKVGNGNGYDIIGIYLEKQPQFFLSKFISKSNGDIDFVSETGKNYLIKTNAPLGQSWLFDSLTNDTAIIIYQQTQTIFGNSDSVKIIKLSNNDTIIISKNHGIIRFPLFDSINKNAELTGIEGRNLGLIIPKFEDFFNFNIGDVFYYKCTGLSRWGTTMGYKKIVIKTKTIIDDTIKYLVDFWSKSKFYATYGLPNDSSDIRNPVFSINYVKGSYNFLNKYNDQLIGDDYSLFYYKPIRVGYDTLFNTVTKSYPYDAFCKDYNNDSIIECRSMQCFVDYRKSFCCGKNLGVISYRDHTIDATPFPNGNQEDLICCIINGVTFGQIPDNSIFPDGSSENVGNLYPMQVYPNPCNNFVQIRSNNNLIMTYLDITIYDAVGRPVYSVSFSDNSSIQLDISDFPLGIYYVKLSNDVTNETHKIIKL